MTQLVLINVWSLHIQKPLNMCQSSHYSHIHFKKLCSAPGFPESNSIEQQLFECSLRKVYGLQSVKFGKYIRVHLVQVYLVGKDYRNLNRSPRRNSFFDLHVVLCHIIYYLYAEVAF